MGKGAKLVDPNKKKKLPLTNSEKAEHFTRALSEKIVDRIEKGDILINPLKKCIQNQSKRDQIGANMPLQSIEESLRSLRVHLKQQKQEQRQYQKMKLLKAQELVVKMKKEKEEQKRKLLEKEEKNILHSRIFSESTLTKMRQKLEERVQNKRKQIEERIRSIAARKSERDQRMFEQQIQYWERIKAVEYKSKSTNNLPLINPQSSIKRKSVGTVPRKNSLSQQQKIQHQNQPYSKQIDFYLDKLRMKQRSLDMKQSQKKNSQRLNKIIVSNQKLANVLSHNHRSNNQFLPEKFYNKSKLYGNQYLKQSLLRVKKNDDFTVENISSPQKDNNSLQESLLLKARQVPIHKNENVEKLKEKWERVLSRIQHRQIALEQGLQLLNSIQRRLDKADFEGIAVRLRKKARIFQSQKPQETEQGIEKQFDRPTPSFDVKA